MLRTTTQGEGAEEGGEGVAVVTRAMINKMWAQQQETLGSVERDGVGDLFNLPQDELHDLVESGGGRKAGRAGERWREAACRGGRPGKLEGELGRAEGHMTLLVSHQQLVET